MGGFYLIGPTHTIRSTAPRTCRCMGYRGGIDQQVQDLLMNNSSHVLDIDQLPQWLADQMLTCHIGDDLGYAIYPNPEPVGPPKPPVYNPNIL